MNFAILSALGVAFGYAIAEKAGVELRDWNLTLFIVGVVGAVHFFWQFRAKIPKLDPVAAFSAVAVLLLTAFQLVPLPVTLLRILSPNRADLLNATLPITGGSTRFVTLTAVPNQTAEYLLTLAGYFLVFLLVRDLSFRLSKWPWATAWPLLIVAALEAVLGVYQVYAQPSGGTATGTYVNRDHYAGLLEMVLPFAAMYPAAIMQREKDNRFESPALPAINASLLLAITAILLVAIILSLSRMGFIAALAALLVAGVTALSLRGRQSGNRLPAARWSRWIPPALLTMVIVLAFVFLPTNALVARFADLANTDQISSDTRVQMWRDTTGLIKAYPLFGCGMGGYESCFLRYKTVAPMATVDYAHNDYLQVLAELGIFGFCAGLIFVMRIVQRTARAAAYASSIDQQYIAIACLASIIAILLHSFVDFNMYVPANGMAFAWVAGIAGPAVSRSTRHPSPKGDAN